MIVVAGVIVGGAVVGIVAGHDDSPYDDHSDYSDAAERERRRREAQRKADAERKKAAREAARRELDDVISRNVKSFEAQNGLKVATVVGATDCAFRDFESDMEPMTESAKQAIQDDVAKGLKRKIEDEAKKIREIDMIVSAINMKMLGGK